MSTENDKGEVSGPDTANDFRIRIVDDKERGIAGVTVKIWYKTGSCGAIPWCPDRTETDANGWAHFEKPVPFRTMQGSYINMDVIVGDSALAAYVSVKDGDVLCYTLDQTCVNGSALQLALSNF